MPLPSFQPDTKPGLWKSIQHLLVRRRTFFTLVVPLALVAVARPKSPWMPWGLAFAFAGETIRIWSAGYLVKSTRLITSGPFAYLRHPLYLGSLLIATGYCFMSGLWFSFPSVWVLYALFFLSAMFYEEETLESAFGDAYRKYKSQTPRLWPRLTPFSSSPSNFSFRQVNVNREPRVALGVLVMLGLFFVKWIFVR
jgi:protein-S-isoprenylcysteine O-methyltransferase Ste14